MVTFAARMKVRLINIISAIFTLIVMFGVSIIIEHQMSAIDIVVTEDKICAQQEVLYSSESTEDEISTHQISMDEFSHRASRGKEREIIDLLTGVLKNFYAPVITERDTHFRQHQLLWSLHHHGIIYLHCSIQI